MTGGDFGAIGQGIGCMAALCVTLVPLGIWKLVELVLWLFNHVSLGIK